MLPTPTLPFPKKKRTTPTVVRAISPTAPAVALWSPTPSLSSAPADLSATLTADLSDFKSAVPINDPLSRLLLVLAQDRISPRRAAVLAYISNLLLRTLPAIDREHNPDDDWEFPRPTGYSAETAGDAPRDLNDVKPALTPS